MMSTTITLNASTILTVLALALLPAMVLAMTAFTRIYIVLAVLRHAIGMSNVPSNQIVLGVALLLAYFVMSPVVDQVNRVAVQPYLKHAIPFEEAVVRSKVPFEKFMRKQTRAKDLQLFQSLSKTPSQAPTFAMQAAAFLTSELRTAFRIGFAIYIPFLIVDMLVSAVLMSMGMIMVSPLAIALPLKLLLFVLVDGWHMLFGSLVQSFSS